MYDYLQHLDNLKSAKEIRARERQKGKDEWKSKTYEDYDWTSLIETENIGKLLVIELEKYLDKHGLPKNGNKKDKIKRIITDFYIAQNKKIDGIIVQYNSEEESSDEEDDDIQSIASDTGSDASGTESDGERESETEELRTTRSGRISKRKRLTDYVH